MHLRPRDLEVRLGESSTWTSPYQRSTRVVDSSLKLKKNSMVEKDFSE